MFLTENEKNKLQFKKVYMSLNAGNDINECHDSLQL